MTETVSATAAAPRAAGSRFRTLTIVLVLGTLAMALALWLLRSAIVTAMIRRSLEGRGVTCEALSVTASAGLGELEVAPTRCDVAEGVIAAIAWDAPIRAHLEGSEMSSLSIETLAITRRASDREPPIVGGTALGVWMQAPARVSGVVHFAARLAEIDSPAMTVSRITVTRDGAEDTELELETLSSPARAANAPVAISIASLTLAAAGGPLGVTAVPRLRGVVVEAERTRGSLEGTVDATFTLPGIGSLQLGSLTGEQRVRVTADQLDTQPRWDVELR